MTQIKQYRRILDSARFRYFELDYRESNLLIGVSPGAWRPELAPAAGRRLEQVRLELEAWIADHPLFAESWEPLPEAEGAPEPVSRMLAASRAAGVGPMAAVAGTVASLICDYIIATFGPSEVVVENGGDCAIRAARELLVGIQPGLETSGLRHALRLEPGLWGVASSSGRIGHSRSFGKADVCTVVCADPALADAWATAVANQVGAPADVGPVLEKFRGKSGIEALYLSCGGSVGLAGRFPLAAVSPAQSPAINREVV